MNTRSTESAARPVESSEQTTPVTFVRFCSRQVRSTCSMNFFEISTAYTLPGATSGANNRVNRPVPAPTSATSSPACSPQAATISSRFWKISRLSPSKFLTDWLTSGLLRKRALISSRFGASAAGRRSPTSTKAVSSTTCAPASRVNKKSVMARYPPRWFIVCFANLAPISCRDSAAVHSGAEARGPGPPQSRHCRDGGGGLTIPPAGKWSEFGRHSARD